MTSPQQQVLTMLAQGRITEAEAFGLYVPLDPHPEGLQQPDRPQQLRRMLHEVAEGTLSPEQVLADAASTDNRPRHLRIRVQSASGENVNVRLPIGLVSQVASWLPGRHVTVNDTVISVDELLDRIRTAGVGHIVEVDSDRGDRVTITLE
ncbi:MAG: hypothetical protein M0Z54_10775 [Thermaerobacter sp.]|nr:hypothetical protein [Thermaerobacter sp.]